MATTTATVTWTTARSGSGPDALRHRLDIVRPCLPKYVDQLRFRSLRVGRAQLDLLFERDPKGELATRVERLEGPLEVNVIAAGAAPGA